MARWTFVNAVLCLGVALSGCTTYRSQEVAFRLPEAYPNVTRVNGTAIAARAFADPKEAEKAFGFDIRGTGLLPVQVVLDNQGPHRLTIVADQTFLVDQQGGAWTILRNQDAYDRVAKSTKPAEVARGTGAGALLGGAAGAVAGAAIGIVTGKDVAQTTGRGAAVGAAGGAIIGGGQALASSDALGQISRDLASKNLRAQEVPPGAIAHGFLFFPGEAPSAKSLRLQVKESDTGKIHAVILPF